MGVARREGWRGERGQMMVIAAIMMPAMLGFVALAVESGFIYAEQRRAQSSADAIARAAATYLYRNTTADCASGGSATDGCYAWAYADDLGYTNAEVTITHPSATAPFNDLTDPDPNYKVYTSIGDCVDARIQHAIPKFFLAIIFEGLAAADARATACMAQVDATYGMVALETDCENSALRVAGSTTLDVNGAGILVNSCGSSAAVTAGAFAVIEADVMDVVGGTFGSGFPASTVTGIAPKEDPLSKVKAPCSGSPAPCPSYMDDSSEYKAGISSPAGTTTVLSGGGSQEWVVLDPGVYGNGTSSGIRTTGTKLYLKPGIYVMRGGGLFLTASAGMLVCDGVADDLDDDGIADDLDSSTAGINEPGACTTALASSSDRGVLIYNTDRNFPATSCDTGGAPPETREDSISVAGTGSIDLQGVSAGNSYYKGMLFFQDSCVENAFTLTGNSNMTNTSGSIYIPNAAVNLSGSAEMNMDSAVYGKTIDVTGGVELEINFTQARNYKPWTVVLTR